MRRLVNLEPGAGLRRALGAMPFLALLLAYFIASNARLSANPDDKLLPSFLAMAESFSRMAFEPSARSGEYLLWVDSVASLRRIAFGVGLSALAGLVVGIANGALPMVRANFSPLVTVISLIPPMALLPVFFIAFGLGEVSKVALIVVGIAPIIIRDIEQRTREIPREQLIKAQTLGAGTWQIVLRVVLPQILPRLIESVRLSLGAAWLFLIAAEAIAATEGLGYRIFLVRRYLAMDQIIPYVLWITVLAFALDRALDCGSRRAFRWYHAPGARA